MAMAKNGRILSTCKALCLVMLLTPSSSRGQESILDWRQRANDPLDAFFLSQRRLAESVLRQIREERLSKVRRFRVVVDCDGDASSSTFAFQVKEAVEARLRAAGLEVLDSYGKSYERDWATLRVSILEVSFMRCMRDVSLCCYQFDSFGVSELWYDGDGHSTWKTWRRSHSEAVGELGRLLTSFLEDYYRVCGVAGQPPRVTDEEVRIRPSSSMPLAGADGVSVEVDVDYSWGEPAPFFRDWLPSPLYRLDLGELARSVLEDAGVRVIPRKEYAERMLSMDGRLSIPHLLIEVTMLNDPRNDPDTVAVVVSVSAEEPALTLRMIEEGRSWYADGVIYSTSRVFLVKGSDLLDSTNTCIRSDVGLFARTFLAAQRVGDVIDQQKHEKPDRED